jgi:hypothetical protein
MSKMTDAIAFFKQQFRNDIQAAIANTPFSLDMLTAIAMQETYYIWGNLFTTLPPGQVLGLCVGDTLDSPRRSAFPKNKADLLAAPNGAQIFAIARQALVDVGDHNAQYGKIAHMNPNKFCHGFGIFQFDIQFCKSNPSYFLQKKWANFGDCLAVALNELKAALRRAYGPNKSALTDKEMVFVAIAYNKGSVNVNGTFKQGFRDDSGKFYGEHIAEFMNLAKSVP